MMSKSLSDAVAKAEQLPEADQERIGRRLSEYVDELRALRADLEQGARSLDAGLGKELDIETVIAKARARYAGS
jgi:hypothetical protein